MENYFMIDGEKIPMSKETAKSLAGKMKKTETYEDVARHLFDGNYCWYITHNGDIVRISIEGSQNTYVDPNNSPTKEQLESILALNKLANVAKYLNGNWLPDFNNAHIKKYYISINKLDERLIISNNLYTYRSSVYFKTEELAKKAIKILGEEEVKKALILNH